MLGASNCNFLHRRGKKGCGCLKCCSFREQRFLGNYWWHHDSLTCVILAKQLACWSELLDICPITCSNSMDFRSFFDTFQAKVLLFLGPNFDTQECLVSIYRRWHLVVLLWMWLTCCCNFLVVYDLWVEWESTLLALWKGLLTFEQSDECNGFLLPYSSWSKAGHSISYMPSISLCIIYSSISNFSFFWLSSSQLFFLCICCQAFILSLWYSDWDLKHQKINY